MGICCEEWVRWNVGEAYVVTPLLEYFAFCWKYVVQLYMPLLLNSLRHIVFGYAGLNVEDIHFPQYWAKIDEHLLCYFRGWAKEEGSCK